MAWITVLGIPAAMYVASISALMFRMQDLPIARLAILGVWFLTIGIYIFHRSSVKPSLHMQPRHRLAVRHRRGLHIISSANLLLAIVVLALYHPLTLILILGSCIGVVLYGRKTITQPIRHCMFLKPVAVGVSIASLTWILAGLPPHPIPVVVIAMICSADALMCDLDDRAYDKSTKCFTLASHLGIRGTWIAAAIIYLLAGVGTMLFNAQPTIGVLLLILFPLPILFKRFGLRTCIDLRPLLLLLLAWII